MPSGFDRMGPYPLWLRQRFTKVSLRDAFRIAKRSGIVSLIPSPSSVTLVLGDGDQLIIEPYRDEAGRPQLSFQRLWKEDLASVEDIPTPKEKEVRHGKTAGRPARPDPSSEIA